MGQHRTPSSLGRPLSGLSLEHTHKYTHAHRHTHTHAHTDSNTCMSTCMSTCMPKQPHTYTCVPLDACVPQSYSHTTTEQVQQLQSSLPTRMHVRVGSANRKNKWRGAERGEGGRKRERASIHRIACPLSIASMFPPSHCMSAVHCFNVSHSPSVKVDSATMGGVRTAGSGHCPAMAD